MIEDMLATRRIEFLDWDDQVIGALVLPAHLSGYPKPTKAEYRAMRQRQVDEFRRNYPRRRYYIEERHIPVVRNGRIVVDVSLTAVPAEYIPTKRQGVGFRQQRRETHG